MQDEMQDKMQDVNCKKSGSALKKLPTVMIELFFLREKAPTKKNFGKCLDSLVVEILTLFDPVYFNNQTIQTFE